ARPERTRGARLGADGRPRPGRRRVRTRWSLLRHDEAGADDPPRRPPPTPPKPRARFAPAPPTSPPTKICADSLRRIPAERFYTGILLMSPPFTKRPARVVPPPALVRKSVRLMVDELVPRLHAAGYDDITAAHQAVFENIDRDGTRITTLATR